MSEKVSWVDEEDNLLGHKTKEEVYEWEVFYRSINLLLFNSKNELLINLRAPTKKKNPNKRSASVNGKVGEESYEEAVRREAKEELNIEVDPEEMFKYKIDIPWENRYRKKVFRARYDWPISPDPKEMEAVLRADIDRIMKDMEENPNKYTEWFKKLLSIYLKNAQKEKKDTNEG